MLRQEDFISMLGEMQSHVDKSIKIMDGLVAELDDADLRFKLVALRQTKHLHLEAMTALKTLLKQHLQKSAEKPSQSDPRQRSARTRQG